MRQKKTETIKSLSVHEKDVGSAEVQVGLLTDKITKLSEHFKKFKKDKHSTMGLNELRIKTEFTDSIYRQHTYNLLCIQRFWSFFF